MLIVSGLFSVLLKFFLKLSLEFFVIFSQIILKFSLKNITEIPQNCLKYILRFFKYLQIFFQRSSKIFSWNFHKNISIKKKIF